jgi:folate-binding protein YgfZ
MDPTELPNALHDMHAAAGAEFQPYERLEIVSTYGDPRAEYDALRTGAALIDLPHRGLLELSGKDRLSFLNNLLTNQTWDKSRKADMPVGTGVYAFFLNLKGRVVTDVNVLNLDDERTLLEMDARHVRPVAAAFDKYLFAEKVKITSRLGSLHELALHGPRAADVLGTAGAAVGELTALASTSAMLFGFQVIIWRDDVCGVPGYNIVADAAAARALWANLLASFGPRAKAPVTLRPVGWAAFNTARIEAGRPLLGVDFEAVPAPTAYPAKKQREQEEGEVNHPGTLAAETGQFARAVSITKGCYLGQEIVARMHARGQVARQVVGLQFEDDALPLAGAGVFDEKGNQVGVVTSSTPSPALGGPGDRAGAREAPHFTHQGRRELQRARRGREPATASGRLGAPVSCRRTRSAAWR